MLPKFSALAVVALTLAASAVAPPAHTQADPAAAYPNRAVKIIVSAPPGGGLDIAARVVADRLAKLWGQPFVVENRPGAGGNLGTEAVAGAEPDGYTLLAAQPAPLTTNVVMYKKLNFDPAALEPLAIMTSIPNTLVVRTDFPANSVQELIAYAKANPGKLSYGSSGVGSVFHLTGELFNRTAGVDIVHVPYRGVSQPMQDTAAGTIQLLHISLSSARGALASGKAKVLAILEPQRYSKMPDVPSLTEILPAFRKPSTWFGFFGPAHMPPAIVARLSAEMRKAVTAPDVRAKLEEGDMIVIADTPEEFAALQKAGIEQFGEIIKAAGIKPQ